MGPLSRKTCRYLDANKSFLNICFFFAGKPNITDTYGFHSIGVTIEKLSAFFMDSKQTKFKENRIIFR